MQVVITESKGSEGEVIGYGRVYQNGVETRYKIFFENGVLDPESAKPGLVFWQTLGWMQHMRDINKITVMEA